MSEPNASYRIEPDHVPVITLIKDARENNELSGTLTLPAPKKVRGCYAITGIKAVEHWNRVVMMYADIDVPEGMERHLPEVEYMRMFADDNDGVLQQVNVYYRSEDDRLLSYRYLRVDELRGVGIVLHDIGEFYFRRSKVFVKSKDYQRP